MNNLTAVESIFFAALEKATPEERAAYLDQSCGGDAELRRHVERLLMAQPKVGGFLQAPAAGLAGTMADPQITERPGTVIGPYKLMEQIGEGGMGLVFVAEQQEPVRRKVALKIIKPGMDTRDVIARFEAERQALALMDHPNIARVLDAGATDTERPYFVMELVKGVPITDYCDHYELTPRERLELFVGVCQAVQHAHSKGVIHRDLKPSNVLIAPHDGKPVVKVIDFGIAKAVGSALTDKTIYTRISQMIGTPLYMSPEQAEINALDVDTRSDVYGLGVLLYELLTGTTPFDRQRLHTAAFDEIRRIIREEEPPRPSTRLTTMGDGLAVMSAKRKTEPGKLSSLFKGDLDWIVMKALEKDRTRRYDTASAMAADVRRFLSEEPIEARPPSAWYRLRKMARRNKAAMTTVTLVAAALLLGTGVSAWQAVRATQAEIAALDSKAEAVTARDQQAEQRLAAEHQRQLAVAAAAAARKSESRAKVEEENARLLSLQALQLARDEKAAREWAEDQEKAAKDQALRAQIARHVTQLILAFQAWAQHDVFEAERILDDVSEAFQQTWEQRHLRDMCRRKLLRLTGHTDEVTSVAMSADGQWVVSGSKDKTVKLWDAQAGREKFTLLGHTDTVRSVAITADGKTIVSGANDRKVRVWDSATGKETAILKGHYAPVRAIAVSADGKRIVSGSVDQTVKLWDTATGSAIRTFTGHTDEVTSVALSTDGTIIVSCSNDKTVRVWDAATGHEKLMLQGSSGDAVTSVAISPDGLHIVTGSQAKGATVWDAVTGQKQHALLGPQSTIEEGSECVAISADGKRVVTGGKKGSRLSALRTWDLATGQEILALKTGNFQALATSADGARIALGCKDKTVKVWNLKAEQAKLTLKSQVGVLSSLAISANGQRIASGETGDGGSVTRVWDAATGKETLALKGVSGPRISADGSRLLTHNTLGSGIQPELRVYDAATGRELLVLLGGGRFPPIVDMSADGKLIAARFGEGAVKLWDVDTGQEKRVLSPGAGNTVTHVALSADGKRMAVATRTLLDVNLKPGQQAEQKSALFVFDTSTGHQILKISLPSTWGIGLLGCIAMSSDGHGLVVAGGSDGPVKVWDVATGKEMLTLHGHAYAVCVAFSEDGTRIISSNEDGTLKVWDATTGQEKLTIKAHAGRAGKVAISANGERIVSSSFADKTVRVWDAPKLSIEQLEKAPGIGAGPPQPPAKAPAATWLLDGVVGLAAFMPDSKSVVTTADGNIRVWEFPNGKELHRITLPPGSAKTTVSAASSKDEKTIAAVLVGSTTIHIYDVATGKKLREMPFPVGKGGTPTGMRISPDGAHLACLYRGKNEATVRIVELATGKEVRSFAAGASWKQFGPTKLVFAYTPDGKAIATTYTGTAKGQGDVVELRLWNPTTGAELRTIRGSGRLDGVNSPNPVFSSDSNTAAFSMGETITVVELATGVEIAKFGKKGAVPTSLAFGKDGTKLYAGLKWGGVLEWNIATREILREFDDAPRSKELSISPDGNTVMLFGVENRLDFVDLRSGK